MKTPPPIGRVAEHESDDQRYQLVAIPATHLPEWPPYRAPHLADPLRRMRDRVRDRHK